TIDGGKSYEMEARARSAATSEPLLEVAGQAGGHPQAAGQVGGHPQAPRPPSPAAALAPPPAPPVDAVRAAAHRVALVALVDRVGQLVDLSPLAGGALPDEALASRIDGALVDASGALRDKDDLDLDALVVEARRELCELGPFTPLLHDEDVTEIQVI